MLPLEWWWWKNRKRRWKAPYKMKKMFNGVTVKGRSEKIILKYFLKKIRRLKKRNLQVESFKPI
jgi:hypothetical protein